ncbi:MAG: sel1 repeat family protein [Verrucomicrobia bacterium]|nr:sel1 repeat family protein [Verrucomicrobiota bacterium]
MLSLLIYELLGGPRKTVESTGRYTPIAVLTEEGNAVLRRGLIDELASAVEMSDLLGGQFSSQATENLLVPNLLPGAAITRSGGTAAPPSSPTHAPPPAAEAPASLPGVALPAPQQLRTQKYSVTGLLLMFVTFILLLGGLGLGGYAIYHYWITRQIAWSRSAHPRSTATATPRRDLTPALIPTPGPTEEEQATAATPARQTIPSPAPGEAGPAPTVEPLDDFQVKLAAAQELGKSGDWQGALKAYLVLIDQFPERSIPMKRLDNLLAGLHGAEGKLDAQSYEQSQSDLLRAAEKGIVPAMLTIGQFSRESNPLEALKWFEIAAAKGSTPAMIDAGLMYSNRHQPGDDRKALEYFLQAANTGNRVGKYLTGECYYFGKGTQVDVVKAVAFLREAAALREPRAMDLLGTHFRKLRQFDQARKYYEDGAAEGYPLSLSNLAVLYMNGEGVQRSPEIAANLFKQSGEKGDPNGMFFYAGCLEEGLGLQKDTKAAAEWFRRSARAGNIRAIEWCRANDVSFK